MKKQLHWKRPKPLTKLKDRLADYSEDLYYIRGNFKIPVIARDEQEALREVKRSLTKTLRPEECTINVEGSMSDDVKNLMTKTV